MQRDNARQILLGDILKITSCQLCFTLLANGASKTFILSEELDAVFVKKSFVFLLLIGGMAMGMAYVTRYAFHLPLVWWLDGRKINFC